MALLILLAASALALAACGKKGDPLPPLSAAPRAATDLAVRQQGSELLVEVSYPEVTVTGAPLPGIEAVEVLRLVRPLAAGAPPSDPDPRPFAAAAELTRTVAGADLGAATQGGELRLHLPLGAEPGARREAHSFAVRFVGRDDERGPLSNLATVVPAAPPSPPGGLAVEPTASGVEVRWTAPGEEVAGFRIYRRRAQERAYGPPLATVPGEATSHLDTSARYGERYIYAVTAVAKGEGVASAPAETAEGAPAFEGGERPPAAGGAESAPRAGAESALMAEREVDYRDRFPPPVPASLVALAEPGQVRLSWQATTAADLAGYHVFRREFPDGAPTRLTAEPLIAPTFLATGLAAGTAYAFHVTAVDASGNESPPSTPAQATAQ